MTNNKSEMQYASLRLQERGKVELTDSQFGAQHKMEGSSVLPNLNAEHSHKQ